MKMREQAQDLPGWCADMAFVPLSLEVLEEVRFDASGRLRKGIWKDSWVSKNCRSERVYNVLTEVRSQGIVKRAAMLPGSSKAPYQLQREILPQVFEATANKEKINISCSQNIVTDTAYKGIEAGGLTGEDQPWREDWLISGCGKAHLVAVHFVPRKEGGVGVKIDPSETRTK
jgi:hypothetical protein